jgi:hypothetical protein
MAASVAINDITLIIWYPIHSPHWIYNYCYDKKQVGAPTVPLAFIANSGE